MKLTIGFLALAFQAAGVLSARTAEEHAALVEECGDLGVLEIPEGADPSLYRHCAEHPIGAERQWEDASLAPEANKPRSDVANMKGAELFARACYSGAPYGCDKGYCWKICGDGGQWCWTALGDGGGAWRTCSVWSQCSDSQDHKCGKNCKEGSKACGCSC
ncbi:uncharacterized protein EKO05_0009463 [Ascochyta rabiei]|uniref:uncharacterized protein n=1 Tax=Didymella rabiei TaxID=5454 RepID=UPI00220771B1|nr:uncharacterized protein EKO05_0009463 [Ascochyta rabiei]UPX19194.1 hypothetical protein EKO05_0009463 [Ascochyta rabiei]